MCGITGALALGSQPTDRAILEQMTQALFHRGPDGFGIAQHGRVGLGHRRLRILDLSTDADQPMWNVARDVAIVFNGEMYNFRRNPTRARSQRRSLSHIERHRGRSRAL